VDEPADAAGATDIDHSPGALDICTHERRSVFDAPVNVAFGSEVNYGVALFRSFGHGSIRYVQTDELHSRVLQRPFQVAQITGIGELVEYNDPVRRVILQNLMNEIGADESSSSGDENAHG
jgi:hypothetical protein